MTINFRMKLLQTSHILIALVFFMGFTGCNLKSFIYPDQVELPDTMVPLPLPAQEVEFNVLVPETTPSDAQVFVDILDEVTGLAFNPKRFALTKVAERFYSGKFSLSQGAVIRYRYHMLTESHKQEFTPLGARIRYRLAYIIPGVQIRDLVSRWENEPADIPTGRIQGVILNSASNAPVGNILVTIAGISTISSIDGSFTLDGVPIGTYNLVAYSLDGGYLPFQQGAVVAAASTTPVSIQMQANKLVSITFIVTPPLQSSSQNPPIRMIGNLLQLGNTFADLQGGMSTLSIRAPQLSMQTDGKYFLRLQLPAGAYLQYKFSIGDGFWNAEHSTDGSFRLRELIVPNKDTTYQEIITSWEASGAKPIHFYITVPDNTPPTEHVSLQLNPFGWMEPIPIWPAGNNQWQYTLFSPMHLVGEVAFRICRNEQCTAAVDAAELGENAGKNRFTPSLIEQEITYQVEEWAFLTSELEPTPVVTGSITPQKAGFMAGVELAEFSHPSWMATYTPALQNIAGLGANWLVITPTWSVVNNSPPVIIQKPGVDPLQADTEAMVSGAISQGLQVAVYPRLIFQKDIPSWWQDAARDQDWWQTWFDRYASFILHQATLAEQAGASAFILGGYDIIPALPSGKLFDGSDSGVPEDVEATWNTLIMNIRSRFSGKIGWAVNYPYLFERTPSFINQVDWNYVLWSAPMSTTNQPDQAEMAATITQLLNQDIKVLKTDLNKPIVLGVQFASANGAAANCIVAEEGCLQINWDTVSVYTDPICKIDLLEQVEMYNALFVAINQTDWLDGIISRGFYPPAIVQDCSPSIYGKPAADVLWYWYPRLLGTR